MVIMDVGNTYSHYFVAVIKTVYVGVNKMVINDSLLCVYVCIRLQRKFVRTAAEGNGQSAALMTKRSRLREAACHLCVVLQRRC